MKAESPTLPRLAYKISEVAVMLGVSTKTIERAIARGDIHCSRKLRHRLIHIDEIQKLAKA